MQTWLGAGRYATQFARAGARGGAVPAVAGGACAGVAAAAAARSCRPARRRGAAPRPDLDPAPVRRGRIADDVAYGAGVWAGRCGSTAQYPYVRGPLASCRSSTITKGYVMANAWFETVAEAQRRAQKRLPKSVYGALLAGSEKGLTLEDNLAAFGELGFAPHVAGLSRRA